MNLEVLRNNHQKILDCQVKDPDGLNDFQKLPDHHARSIEKVGIERFRLPLNFKHLDGTEMSHDASADMFVYLSAGKTGVNMSRFCAILQEEAGKSPVDNQFFCSVLTRFRKELRDFENEDFIPASYLKLKFNYPLKQKSLKTDNWGWQYYACEISGSQLSDQASLMNLTVEYEYSSTCPLLTLYGQAIRKRVF